MTPQNPWVRKTIQLNNEWIKDVMDEMHRTTHRGDLA
jgi:hypothetical protein